MESVVANETVKIKFDMVIRTDVTCPHNRPDLVVMDKKAKKIWIIEVRVSSRPILAKTECEKKAKYERLAGDLRSQHPEMEVEVVPIVLSWDGSCTRHIMKHFKKLAMDRTDLARIQIITLKRSADLINADLFDSSSE